MRINNKPESDATVLREAENDLKRVALVVLLTVISSGIYILLSYMVSRFSEMFSSFGAEIPLLTRFFLIAKDFTPGIVLLVVCIGGGALVPSISVKWRKNLLFWCKLNPLIAVGFAFASFLSMYLPIFYLGQAV